MVSSLSAQTLAAQFSNLSASQLSPIETGALAARQATNLGVQQYVIPLVFPLLQEINTQLNTTFLEPMTVQVHWNDTHQGVGPDKCVIDTVQLKVRYKNYPEESTSQILASNFSQPELNMLSDTWYNENTKVHTTEGAGDFATTMQEAVVDLKNTDAVQESYVQIRHNKASTTDAISHPLVQPESLTFTGSGQEIFSLQKFELLHSKITSNGFATGAFPGKVDLNYIAEFQTGRYAMTPNTAPCMSNCLSLREVNAPRMTIEFMTPVGATQADTYSVTVVEKCLAIYAISSATGRLTLALSN